MVFAVTGELVPTVRIRDEKVTAKDALLIRVRWDETPSGVYEVRQDEAGKVVAFELRGNGVAITVDWGHGTPGEIVYRVTLRRGVLVLMGEGNLWINLLVSDSDDGKTVKKALIWYPVCSAKRKRRCGIAPV